MYIQIDTKQGVNPQKLRFSPLTKPPAPSRSLAKGMKAWIRARRNSCASYGNGRPRSVGVSMGSGVQDGWRTTGEKPTEEASKAIKT